MSEWKPIETAPKDGTPVLVWGGMWDGEIGKQAPSTVALVTTRNGLQFAIEGTSGYAAWVTNPTHWMPLPSPPEAPGE